MNGMYRPLPQYPSLENYLVVEDYVQDNISLSAGGYNSATWTVAKKTGYKLMGIAGVTCENATTSGSNSSRIMFYRTSYELGAEGTDSDSLYVGIRNTHTSAAAIKVTLQLLYFKID